MACIINKSVGTKCTAVLIDHGLLRKSEAKNCVVSLKDGLGINVHLFDESKLFFSRLFKKLIIESSKFLSKLIFIIFIFIKAYHSKSVQLN